MPRYSVIINWSDSDREQGTFGWPGIAADEAEAERMTREAMAASDAVGDDEDEPVSSEDVGGSLVEITMGAVWEAQRMEDALRAILPYAESRAEDMADCAETAGFDLAKAGSGNSPDGSALFETWREARVAADKAVAAVDAAKALLASLDGDAPDAAGASENRT